MLSIQLTRSVNSGPLYKQIYQALKQQILEGILAEHDQLPSKRELADHLHVSMNSVISAYQQLIAEGYVYTKERRGYFVEALDAFIAAPEEEIFPEELIEKRSPAYQFSFSHMNADASLFPFRAWQHCEQQALRHYAASLDNLEHPQGQWLLREEIARTIGRTRGVRCRPEQIVLGASTQWLFDLLAMICDKHALFAVEHPGYQRIYQQLHASGRPVLPITVDYKGMSPQELEESGASIAVVTPSHQMPTGLIMPVSRRIQLLNWSYKEEGRYIVEDDYDAEFKYEGDPIPALHSLDDLKRVIYVGTFSKSLLPGLRLSYMVLPPALLAVYKHQASHLMQTSSSLIQLALYVFIKSGEYQKHIKRMSKHYKTIRAELIESLYDTFGSSISITGEKAGLHFLMEINTSRPTGAILEKAKEYRLELYGMDRFWLKETAPAEGRPVIIIGFARLRSHDIASAVSLLYRCCFGRA